MSKTNNTNNNDNDNNDNNNVVPLAHPEEAEGHSYANPIVVRDEETNSKSTSTSTSTSNHNNAQTRRDPNRRNPYRNIHGTPRAARTYFCQVCGGSGLGFNTHCRSPNCSTGIYVLIVPLGSDEGPYNPAYYNLHAWCNNCGSKGNLNNNCHKCGGFCDGEPTLSFYNEFREHYGLEVSD